MEELTQKWLKWSKILDPRTKIYYLNNYIFNHKMEPRSAVKIDFWDSFIYAKIASFYYQ